MPIITHFRPEEVKPAIQKFADGDVHDGQTLLTVLPGYEFLLTLQYRLRPRWYYLLFGRSSQNDPELPEKVMALLLGPKFEKTLQEHYERCRVLVPDENGFELDFSDVRAGLALSYFNLLAQYRNVLVPSVATGKLAEIDNMVNLAIALSIVACRNHRGIFLWQSKARTTMAGKAHWQRVPDILLVRHRWKPVDQARFAQASFEEKRDFLCANGRLRNDELVLPFLVDFPGRTADDDQEARVTADVDGKRPPLAAISIPGAAFIGWLEDFHPDEPDLSHWREERKGPNLRREVIVPVEKREAIRVGSTHQMYQKATSMLNAPIPRGLMLYKHILELSRLAHLEDKRKTAAA